MKIQQKPNVATILRAQCMNERMYIFDKIGPVTKLASNKKMLMIRRPL